MGNQNIILPKSKSQLHHNIGKCGDSKKNYRVKERLFILCLCSPLALDLDIFARVPNVFIKILLFF